MITNNGPGLLELPRNLLTMLHEPLPDLWPASGQIVLEVDRQVVNMLDCNQARYRTMREMPLLLHSCNMNKFQQE